MSMPVESASATPPGLRTSDSSSLPSDSSESGNTSSPGEDYPSNRNGCNTDMSEPNTYYSYLSLPWRANQPQQEQQPDELSCGQDKLLPQHAEPWATEKVDLLRFLASKEECIIHQPRPQPPQPIQIGVPFLVDYYSQNLTCGPQRLPTVFEEESEEQPVGIDDGDEIHHQEYYADQQEQSHLVEEGEPGYLSSSPSTRMDDTNNPNTAYVGCHQYQDLTHHSSFLSQAIQMHVLEETPPPLNYSEAALPTAASMEYSPPPHCQLFRPQALRVVCPPTWHRYDYDERNNGESATMIHEDTTDDYDSNIENAIHYYPEGD